MGGLGGAPMGQPGPPQFPSADPQAILALLTQLDAHDQQQLGVAQVSAVGQAFSALMQGQPDPMAAGAATGPPNVVGPPMGGAPGY